MVVKHGLIQIDVKHFYPFVDPGNKLPFNFFQRHTENCFENIAHVHLFCKTIDKRFEHLKSIALHNELNQQGSLIVGKIQVRQGFGPGKALVQLTEPDYPVFLNRLYELNLLVPSPLGSAVFFFKNGYTFGEPARYIVSGHLQGDDMGEFMPDDLLPVNRTRRFMPSWRTESDYAAKTDPEEVTYVRQPRSSHRKVLVIGK